MTENIIKTTAICIGKLNYIAGVSWQSIEVNKAKALKSRAKQNGYDYWMAVVKKINDETSYLFGGVDTTLIDVNEKLPFVSLASHVQQFHTDNSYSIFKVDDSNFWFVAYVNGFISPLSDIYGDKEQILNAVELFLKLTPSPLSEWDITSPSGFFDVDYRVENIREVIQRRKPQRTSFFKKTHDKKGALVWGAVIVAALLFYFGNNYYHKIQEEKKIQAAQKALAEKRKNAIENRIDELKPWSKLPRLHDLLSACNAKWKVAPLSIAGWRFSSAKCEYPDGAADLVLTYSMIKGGTVNDFSARLPYFYGDHVVPKFNIPGAANEASFELLLPKIALPMPESLPSFDIQTQRLTSYAQRMHAELRLEEVNTDYRDGDGLIIPMPWRALDFTFVTDIPLERLFDASRFNSIGMRAKVISLELIDYRIKYTVEGTIYATE